MQEIEESGLSTAVFKDFSVHSGGLVCIPSSRLSVQAGDCLFCIADAVCVVVYLCLHSSVVSLTNIQKRQKMRERKVEIFKCSQLPS